MKCQLNSESEYESDLAKMSKVEIIDLIIELLDELKLRLMQDA